MRIELKTPWLYLSKQGSLYGTKRNPKWFCSVGLKDMLGPLLPNIPIPGPFRLCATTYKPPGKHIVIYVDQDDDGALCWGTTNKEILGCVLPPPTRKLRPFIPKPKSGKNIGRAVRLYITLELKK